MPGLFHAPPLELPLDEEDEEEEEELLDDEEDEPPEELVDEPPLDELPPEEPLLLLGGGGGGTVEGGGGVGLPDEFAGSVGSVANCDPPGGPKRSDCDAPLQAITVVNKTDVKRTPRFSMADELYPPRPRCPMPRAHPFRLIRRGASPNCDVCRKVCSSALSALAQHANEADLFRNAP